MKYLIVICALVWSFSFALTAGSSRVDVGGSVHGGEGPIPLGLGK